VVTAVGAEGSLGERWRRLRDVSPGLRTRDAAAALGVSEAELLDGSGDHAFVRIAAAADALLPALPGVGRCMALTRNEHAVVEVRGHYGGVELGPHVGQVVGDGVDLRIFPLHWHHAFAVREPAPGRPGELRRSVHVFDAGGTAVHKVYLEPGVDPTDWDAMVAARVMDAPSPIVVAPPAPPAPRRDAPADRDGFVREWDAMTDTHDFFHLLRRHQLGRVAGLRAAGRARAVQVAPAALEALLRAAADGATPIMIFVGNRGCLQIYAGEVRRIVVTGPWLNVLDPGFNLHLRADRIATAWIVRKPTRAGVVTSLELYDADGETIALVFRHRDDREQAEDPAWSAMLGALPRPR
jgi:putative hemin transport protein